MSTKCIIIGKLKPIQFLFQASGFKNTNDITETDNEPSDYHNVELICAAPSDEYYDVMFAYDNNKRQDGCIYFGHWNNGIVK